MPAGPYGLGSRTWPGLSKLIEECGEVLQIAGKLIATGGEATHWDGSDLRERLQEELGDLMAACRFFVVANLPEADVFERMLKKERLFWQWHGEQQPTPPGGER